MIYYYKDKPYQLVHMTKIKLNGIWQEAVLYKCLYVNPNGMLWVRLKDDFFNNFKPKIDESKNKAAT